MKNILSNHWLRIITVCGLCSALISLSTATARRSGLSPAELRGLKFSHTAHQQNAPLSCAECHTAAASSVSGHDNLLPNHAQCASCHEVENVADCQLCHLDSPPQKHTPGTTISKMFDHERHTASDIACATCHSNLEEPFELTRSVHAPHMAACMACHTEVAASNECRACHEPTESWKPRDHTANWLHRHGAESEDMEANCAMCHRSGTEFDCQICHQGDAVLNPHPRNYVFRHGHDAHLSDLSCASCHEQRDFCNECHTAMNVLPATHFKPGWVTAAGGAHGTAAQFDLESCAACHDAQERESICATCHTR